MNVRRVDFAAKQKKPTTVDLVIGRNIRRLRRLAKKTMYDLAPRVGVSMQQLQKYETGVSRVSGGMIVKLASELGVSVVDFFPPEHARDAFPLVDSCELAELQRELIDVASRLGADKLRAAVMMVRALAS